jgi:hypothetical protein
VLVAVPNMTAAPLEPVRALGLGLMALLGFVSFVHDRESLKYSNDRLIQLWTIPVLISRMNPAQPLGLWLGTFLKIVFETEPNVPAPPEGGVPVSTPARQPLPLPSEASTPSVLPAALRPRAAPSPLLPRDGPLPAGDGYGYGSSFEQPPPRRQALDPFASPFTDPLGPEGMPRLLHHQHDLPRLSFANTGVPPQLGMGSPLPMGYAYRGSPGAAMSMSRPSGGTPVPGGYGMGAMAGSAGGGGGAAGPRSGGYSPYRRGPVGGGAMGRPGPPTDSMHDRRWS